MEWIDITFDKSRVNAQMRTGNIENAKRLETIGTIKLRFVKIRLNSGTDEYLITNIPCDKVSTNEISTLYYMRWGVETAFYDMKNKLQIENFTGSKPIIIEQDIYATGYLYNIISDIYRMLKKREIPVRGDIGTECR